MRLMRSLGDHREARVPLYFRGVGIGPKAAFSYDELDVGDVFAESTHIYDLDIVNQAGSYICDATQSKTVLRIGGHRCLL